MAQQPEKKNPTSFANMTQPKKQQQKPERPPVKKEENKPVSHNDNYDFDSVHGDLLDKKRIQSKVNLGFYADADIAEALDQLYKDFGSQKGFKSEYINNSIRASLEHHGYL